MLCNICAALFPALLFHKWYSNCCLKWLHLLYAVSQKKTHSVVYLVINSSYIRCFAYYWYLVIFGITHCKGKDLLTAVVTTTNKSMEWTCKMPHVSLWSLYTLWANLKQSNVLSYVILITITDVCCDWSAKACQHRGECVCHGEHGLCNSWNYGQRCSSRCRCWICYCQGTPEFTVQDLVVVTCQYF